MADRIRIAQKRVVLDDPHDCTDAADQLTILHAVFDTLIKRRGQGFVPHLAKAWSVSDDARNWVFHLHSGHRFHDGTVCDAAAVAQSLVRMTRPDKGYALGAPGVWRQYLGAARIGTPDAATVEVDLPEPMADLLDVLEQGFIAAPSSFAWLDSGDTSRPVGSGPYKVATGANGAITAVRVPEHFAPGPSAEVTWIAEPDAARRRQMLSKGQVEVASDLTPEDAATLMPPDHTALSYMSPVAIIFLLNAAREPLSDTRVRRALSLSVDREALIAEVLGGHGRSLPGFVSAVHFGAGQGSGAGFDPDLARALLAEAGHGGGLTLEVDCPTRLPDEAERLTAALAGQLSVVGVTLKVHLHHDREAYAHMVRRKEIHDMCVFDSSPMSTFRVLHEKIDARVAGSWWQGFHNATVEGLLDAARATPGQAERAALYADAYGVLQADPPWLTLYNPMRFIGLVGAHEGFVMPVDGVIDVTALPFGG